MEQNRLIYLISRHNQNGLSPEESRELETWIEEDPDHSMLFDKLSDQNGFLSDQSGKRGPELTEAALDRVHARIKRHRTYSYKLWTTVVAAALGILLLSIYVYYREKSAPLKQSITRVIDDVAPGSNKATLRLANGRIISLDSSPDGTIAQEQGVTISKKESGRLIYNLTDADKETKNGLNVIATPKGGQYQVQLPDGSKVWLNAASTLIYASSLRERGDDKRRVTLTGEAYFEVARDKQHPFIVVTGDQQVEVMGTHFNVNSYADEEVIRTTLLEGSVKVEMNAVKPTYPKEVVLKPGQQSSLTKTGIKVTPADIETAVAWKNNKIIFKEADVQVVLRQVARWYDLDVKYNGPIPKDLITGTISRQSQLSTILKMFSMIGITYRLEEQGKIKTLIVNP